MFGISGGVGIGWGIVSSTGTVASGRDSSGHRGQEHGRTRGDDGADASDDVVADSGDTSSEAVEAQGRFVRSRGGFGGALAVAPEADDGEIVDVGADVDGPALEQAKRRHPAGRIRPTVVLVPPPAGVVPQDGHGPAEPQGG